MDFVHSITAARIIFILAFVNLITGALIFFSCRCIPGMVCVGRLMRLGWFKRFYRYHCYIWWIFWVSVAVHSVLAILFMSIPF